MDFLIAINNFFDSIEDLIVSFIHTQTLIGPFFLLLIEEMGVPLPVPGDVVITYAGYQVSRGRVSLMNAYLTFMVAVLIGSSVLYFLSRKWGQTIILKLGKYINLDTKKLETVEKKFKKYGPLVIIVGRHIPGFRIPITLFSGMSKISYPVFLISTLISIVFWIAFYLSLGERLGPKTLTLVHAHHGFYLFALIPIVIAILYFLFLRYRKKAGVS